MRSPTKIERAHDLFWAGCCALTDDGPDTETADADDAFLKGVTLALAWVLELPHGAIFEQNLRFLEMKLVQNGISIQSGLIPIPVEVRCPRCGGPGLAPGELSAEELRIWVSQTIACPLCDKEQPS
jgi:hypothetical protein